MSSFQHKLFVAWLAGAAVAVGLAGCAGNGDGLNSKGLPPGSGSSGGGAPTGPFTADFQSIQDNVFTPICVPCHSGASAPKGLMLDATNSYNLLVGHPSTEVPTLDRVKPDDPDSSYIIIKLQGSAGIVGSQMPLGETPLPQATIDVIRQWITNGAPPASAAPAASASANAMQRIQSLADSTPAPFNVTQTSPVEEAVMEAPVNHILVAFNHEVDATLVNYTNLTVERLESTLTPAAAPTSADSPFAPAGSDAATQATRLPAYTALAEGNPRAIIITPVAPLLPGTYRVTVRGTGGGALADLDAQALGSDYSFTFNVDVSP